MKRFIQLFVVILATVLLNSCKKDDADLKITGSATIATDGSVTSNDIKVSAENTDWTVTVTTGSDWLTAAKNGNTVTLISKENTNTSNRTAILLFTAVANGALTFTVTVTQLGTSPTPTSTSTPTSKIMGKWKYSWETNAYCMLTFNTDGTFIYFEHDPNDDPIDRQDTGYYIYDGNTNILTTYYKDGESDNDTITWITDNTFRCNFADNGSIWVRQ